MIRFVSLGFFGVGVVRKRAVLFEIGESSRAYLSPGKSLQGSPVAFDVVIISSEGNVLRLEDGQAQIHSVHSGSFVLRLAQCVGASVSRWLENPAYFVRKHAMVKHHAVIGILPIHGHHLYALAPKVGGIIVRAVEPLDAVWIAPHQEVFVMQKQCTMMLFVEMENIVFANGEDVIGLCCLLCVETFKLDAPGVDCEISEPFMDRYF